MPACRNNASRLALALASTSTAFCFPCKGEAGETLRGAVTDLLEPVGDAPLRQIIGRHLDQYLIPYQNTDTVLTHLARCVGNDLVSVLELHPKRRIGQQFRDHAREFQQLFLCHSVPLSTARFKVSVRAGGCT